MLITRFNPLTGKNKTIELPVTEQQMMNWHGGLVAQRAFPNLNADQREFIISGIPPGEWESTLATTVPRKAFIEVGGSLAAEASNLGWPAGFWPEHIKFSDDQVFEKGTEFFTGTGEDAEPAGFVYTRVDGSQILKIFND
jgi:hypothetical protein